MSHSNSPWDRFYQKLNLIFNGIVASSMIPFALVFLQRQKTKSAPLIEGDTQEWVKAVLILVAVLVIIVANWQWPKWLNKVRGEHTIKSKLNTYLQEKIKHFALIEMAAIVSLVGYYLLKAEIFAFIYVGVLIVFSMHRPTFGRVSKEIGETESDLISWSKDQK